MILYFSATGNSAYVAKRIARILNDETLNLFEKIRNRDTGEMRGNGRPWVVVVPTYAWRIPHLVQDWLEKAKLSGSKDLYVIMTCGQNIGNAGQYLAALCRKKGLRYQGCQAVVMPENYIALFSTPTREEALAQIQKAEPVIDQAAQTIQSCRPLAQPDISLLDRLSSGVVNRLFYPLFVHAKKFSVTNACISCGNCARVCPLSNVRLQNGRPVWGKDCTHCMACICLCPTEAIEYGSHSRGLPRYQCPKKPPEGSAPSV